jgi:hypothetical protein
MNYIRHLTAFYDKLATDERFTSAHVSLYLALFQCWNMNHFENPFSVNRAQVLHYSKIGSNHTYYNALKDLHAWGYINYDPSASTGKGAFIHLCIFAPSETESSAEMEQERCKNAPDSDANMHQDRCKYATVPDANMHPSLNYININNKREREENSLTQNLENKSMEEKKQNTDKSEPTPGTSQRKKVAPKKESVMPLPELSHIIDFFREEHSTELEARKFFNHFESNGWKVGGKSPMKNWHASARNWILNIHKYSPGSPSTQSNINTPKNYGEPL